MKVLGKPEINIGKVGQRRQVVIPRKIFDSVGLKEGNFIEISRRGAEVIIRPKIVVNADDVLTPEEEKTIELGFRQLKQGQHIAWKQLKHELGL